MMDDPTDPKSVLILSLTPDELTARGVMFEPVGDVETVGYKPRPSRLHSPQRELQRKAAELGANAVLGVAEDDKGVSRGLAVRVFDTSRLTSEVRRFGLWVLLGGLGAAALFLVAYMVPREHLPWLASQGVRVIGRLLVMVAIAGIVGGVYMLIRGREP